jgi:signal transduction histidine kinase
MDVMRGDDVIAQVRYEGNGDETPPERLVEAARAAGLALEHASSRARLRAELAELNDSRTRLVEVGDLERQRLERDLHDGAQQRLIALSVALQQGTANGPARVRARSEILAALEELRDLAHGIYPAALTDGGLDAALRELGENSRVPMRLEAVPIERFGPRVEAAIYRLVLDVLGWAEHAGDGRTVTIAIRRAGAALEARLVIPGVDASEGLLRLETARDRVAALTGRFIVATEDGEAVVEARAPCES